MFRHTPEDAEAGEDAADIGRLERPVDPDRQAFSRKLVHHVQHAIRLPVMGAILHDVIRPDMV